MKKIFLLTFLFVILQFGNVFAFVEKHIDKQINYEMEYPIVYTNNKAAQDKINQDIYHYIAAFRDDFKAGKFYNGKFFYEVKFEDNDYVSLVITDYRFTRGAAHGGAKKIGVVYDKKTGRKLPLSHFLKITLNDLLPIYRINLYDGGGKKFSNAGFSDPKRVSEDYYLLGNGGIALIYREYELAAYAAGSPTIRLSAEEVDWFNRKNRSL